MTLLHPWSRLSALGYARRVSPRKMLPEAIKRWNIVVGDKVQVINGDAKGSQGKVLAVYRELNKVRVEGINLRRRFMGAREGQTAGMFTFEAPLNYADVALVNPSDNKPTRIRWEFVAAENRKVRVSVRTDSIIPHPNFSRRDWKTRESYKEAAKDTKANAASVVSFKPSVLTFEESVLAGLGQLKLKGAKKI